MSEILSLQTIPQTTKSNTNRHGYTAYHVKDVSCSNFQYEISTIQLESLVVEAMY